jgi:replicative DNA helicase
MAGEKKQNPSKMSPIEQLNAQYGKLPPQAIEVEEAVLGALMLERDAYIAVADIIDTRSFYKEEHQKYLRSSSIYRPRKTGRPANGDPGIKKPEHTRRSRRATIHYPAYVASGLGSSHRVPCPDHCSKFMQRELIRVSTEIQTKAYDDTMDVDDLIDFAETSMFKVAEGNIKKETVPIKPLLKEASDLIEQASKREDGLSGVPSGFTALDRVTSGWQKTDLVIIAARPSMGKTAFVLSMARNMAVDHKKPVAVFSLEMSSLQLVNRLIASETERGQKKSRTDGWLTGNGTPATQDRRTGRSTPLYRRHARPSVFEFRPNAVG